MSKPSAEQERQRSASDRFYKSDDATLHSDTSMNHMKISIASDCSRIHSFCRSNSTLVPRPVSQTEEELKETFPLELSYLKAALFATVLEDTLLMLRILVEANTQILINSVIQDMDENIAVKFGVEPGPVKDELAGLTYKNVACEEFKLYKLDKDRVFFAEVISNTYSDLALKVHYKCLLEYITSMQSLKNNYDALKEEETQHRALIRELRRQLRQQRVQNKTLVYDAMVIQDMLEKRIEDAELTEETALRSVGVWERARTEQHLEKIRQTEDGFDDAVSFYKDKYEQEQRIHAEIETFVTIATRDTMDQVELWMAKYENDLEQIDLKLQIKRNRYLDKLEKRKTLEKKYNKRAREMEAWNEYKEKRRLEQERQAKMHQSAIIVQAWWRGLLVRKQFGPYRPKKKRGGKKAGRTRI